MTALWRALAGWLAGAAVAVLALWQARRAGAQAASDAAGRAAAEAEIETRRRIDDAPVAKDAEAARAWLQARKTGTR